jgi:hypothetical protein
MIQLDDLSSWGYVTRNETELKEMSAETWARRQFVAWQLLYLGPKKSAKPFDGLDKMILLSWVLRKFSESVPLFVLHYWDLRMSNVIIDDNNNLVA